MTECALGGFASHRDTAYTHTCLAYNTIALYNLPSTLHSLLARTFALVILGHGRHDLVCDEKAGVAWVSIFSNHCRQLSHTHPINVKPTSLPRRLAALRACMHKDRRRFGGSAGRRKTVTMSACFQPFARIGKRHSHSTAKQAVVSWPCTDFIARNRCAGIAVPVSRFLLLLLLFSLLLPFLCGKKLDRAGWRSGGIEEQRWLYVRSVLGCVDDNWGAHARTTDTRSKPPNFVSLGLIQRLDSSSDWPRPFPSPLPFPFRQLPRAPPALTNKLAAWEVDHSQRSASAGST